MKEEQFKKIIKKSTLTTSEGFVDELMSNIKESKEVKNKYVLWQFKPILSICVVLILVLTFLLFQVLGLEVGVLSSMIGTKKIPIFIVVTSVLFYYLNEMVKLDKNSIRIKKESLF